MQLSLNSTSTVVSNVPNQTAEPLDAATKNELGSVSSRTSVETVNNEDQALETDISRESVGDKQWAKALMGPAVVAQWDALGLDISDELWTRVADDLEHAMGPQLQGTELMENLKSNSLLMNRHQLFMDAGIETPEWFLSEYAETLDILEKNAPDVAQAFRNGELFHSATEKVASPQTNVYREIAEYT